MAEEIASESRPVGRVLLVEDEAGHAMLIKRALKGLAVEVVHAESVAVVSERFAESRPDLVITDYKLPDGTALDVIRSVRAVDAELPLLVLTSSTSLSDAVDSMREGANDFIVKNFDADFGSMLAFSVARVMDAFRLKAERIQLQRDLQLLHAAIAQSNDGLAVANRAGGVAYANPGYVALAERFGGTVGEVSDLVGAQVERSEKLVEQLREQSHALAAGSFWHTEFALADLEQWYDLSLSVVEHDEVDGLVVWVRDITEQKQREKFQKDILSTTSHDLKGPLGAVSLSAELLLEMLPEKEKPHELVLRVASAAQTATNLIDEFLSARRLQEGTLVLRPQLNRLCEVIDEVRDSYEIMATTRQQQLPISCDEQLIINADRLGLTRVLSNLVGNAIKFTPKLGVIAVTAEAVPGGVEIKVSDTGCGMEPAEMQEVFGRFSRLAKHAEVEGTGIGLFVVRNIVHAHGGSIDLVSQPGAGTCFTLFFPDSPPVNDQGEIVTLSG